MELKKPAEIKEVACEVLSKKRKNHLMPLRQQINVKDNEGSQRFASSSLQLTSFLRSSVILNFAILILNEKLPDDPTCLWSHALS